MERVNRPRGFRTTKKGLAAASLSALVLLACRPSAAPAQPEATASPTIRAVLNPPLLPEGLLANYMEQLVSKMKQLEVNNSGRSLGEISDNDLNLYIGGYAEIYSFTITGGIVAPSEYVQATKVVKKEEYYKSYGEAAQQRRLIASIPDIWVLVLAPTEKGEVFINMDSFYFTPDGMRSIGSEDNALKVFAGVLGVAYDRITPSLMPRAQPRSTPSR